MFSFYSATKINKFTLKRYVTYTDQDIVPLTAKVSEELSKIDRGFSFSVILSSDKNIKDNGPVLNLDKAWTKWKNCKNDRVWFQRVVTI